MGVIIYSFNLKISPKMSQGVLKCDIVMLQSYMCRFCKKRFCNNKGVLFVSDPVLSRVLPLKFLAPTWQHT